MKYRDFEKVFVKKEMTLPEWNKIHDVKNVAEEAKTRVKYNEIVRKLKAENVIIRNYDSELCKAIGKTHYDAVHDILEKAPNPKAMQLWIKFEEQIRVAKIDLAKTPFHSNGQLYFNIEKAAAGEEHQKPYQVLFHEGAHNIDWLLRDTKGFYYSSTYKNGAFIKAIHDDVNGLLKAHNIVDVESMFLEIEKRHKEKDFKWFFEQGYITEYNCSIGKFPIYLRPRTKKKKEELKEKFKGTAEEICSKNKKLLINEIIKTGNKKVYGDLSDVLHGATKEKINCGVGHESGYWEGATYGGIELGLATETFAHFIEGSIANIESLKFLKMYLPRTNKVFEEMIDDILGRDI